MTFHGRASNAQRSRIVICRPANVVLMPTSNIEKARALILVAAFLSFLLSVSLFFVTEDKTEGIFVGLWVPSILALGAVILPPRR